MTRYEFIKKEAENYTSEDKGLQKLIRGAFIAGAVFADKHPNTENNK